MAQDISVTLEQIKRSLNGSSRIKKATTYSTSNNLAPYSLQAPAKSLVPIFTPIRNELPRKQDYGLAAHWREITSILGSGFQSMAWVPEGQRSDAITVVTNDRTATFTTIGEEGAVTTQGYLQGQGFDDLAALSTLNTLQSLMRKEEYGILCGNKSYALTTPITPTSATATSAGATLNATYSAIVVALTAEGYFNLKGVALATGITQQKTITGKDGKTYTLKIGASTPSANKTQAVTTGNALVFSTTPVVGAYAYAWYVGTAGSEKLEVITTVATVTIASLAGTGQLASALTSADYSTNATAFDGFLTVGANNSTAYYKALTNGTKLTASGHGSINEVDTMFQAMWDNYQASPSVMYINSQEMKNITSGALSGGSSAPLTRFVMDNNAGNSVVAGQVVGAYYNPYQAGGPVTIPVQLHPYVPPGTIVAWAKNLPQQFQNANVPNVAEVLTVQDYFQKNWPEVTMEQQFGVYAIETLAIYAPLGIGIITNITDGLT